MRILLFVIVSLLVGTLVWTSSSIQATQVASPTPAHATATPLPNALGPEHYPLNVNPLTGLPVTDSSVLERRPLAIKISNAPRIVRPQAGLAQADLVYEHYVEGYLTRFTAIFYSQTPPYVGSVRSARIIDLQIPLMYESLFAYSGANGPINLRLYESQFANRIFEATTIGQPLFYREPSIEIPHNLFAVPDEIWSRATALGVNSRPSLSGFAFSEAVPPRALSAARLIAVNYGPTIATWVYDAPTGLYWRYVDGQQHADALDNTPITAANVIIIWAHHQPDVTVLASEWQGIQEFSIEIQIWTLGPATLFRDGKRYDGLWHRWADAAMLTFWQDDTMTEPLYLKPGVTWFQVVPLDFNGLVVYAQASR